eukprot:CAMPEP_0182530374 /NCGR_PEP_ID=MMETSP1323-20130603/5867_1 /TAXON_ID=236787 /ORGANISM="Florenciella parvula, Strain RCC1693" /LENGTH=74 /DNA_ID=CAMNT_0024739673 /DNA_START=335 /DNA_END=555 /DNA_ORIENTATION=-
MAKERAGAVRIVKELPCRLALLRRYMDDLEVVVVSQFQVYGPSQGGLVPGGRRMLITPPFEMSQQWVDQLRRYR